MGALRFSGITKLFGAVRALEPLDLDVADGEFLTLLGPSGSGKTTLLNICAGYLPPTDGQLLVNGVDVAHVAELLGHTSVDMVMQHYGHLAQQVAHMRQAAAKAVAVQELQVAKAVNKEVPKANLRAILKSPKQSISQPVQQVVAARAEQEQAVPAVEVARESKGIN